jgi:group I intron endonuclease
MVKSGIYAIRNKESGKVYVGSAVSVNRRWNLHRHRLTRQKHHSRHLQAAWNLYGSDAFEFIILEEVIDKSKLIEREQYWMNFYKSYNRKFGYNVNPIAGSSFGVKRTEEYKNRIRKSLSGRKLSEAHIFNVKASLNAIGWKGGMLGKTMSTETKLKMRLSHLGKKQSVEHIKNAAAARRGLKWTAESRARQSVAQKLRWEKNK